jgi:hypothetical protein
MTDSTHQPRFRVADVFDVQAADGTAVMGPDHERLPAGEERDRLLAYLSKAPAALATASLDVDRVDPAEGRVVPMGFRTDGVWLWSEELTYYLDRYGYAPPVELRRHIAGNDYQAPEVPMDVLLAAADSLM